MQRTLTLQIATFGPDDYEAIVSGIKSFPVHKMALICYDHDKSKAEDFARKIKSVLGLPVSLYIVNEENVVRDTLERINEIMMHSQEFHQILVNVSSGEKLLGCAALSSSFVNGIKAFGMDRTKTYPILMPVLKLSYNEIVSDAKVRILKAIEKVGGTVDSLEELEQTSGFGKPLLSYHVQGSKEAKGLVSMGLLDVERKERGKVSVSITTLGKLLINNYNPPNGHQSTTTNPKYKKD
ncbi:MAG: hypothetical protein M3162_03650 [Thermoproteota archaeon]|nr:hypothetical protein [Thermoproteota archaeon]